jgi:DeoR/GlpR family transcriptional regulator of sugar metabolism
VAQALAAHPRLEVIMLGGMLFRHSMVNMGAQTVEAVSHMHIDLYLMGVTGVHPSAGLTTSYYEEAALKRAFHSRAAETVVLASPEKLMAASAYAIAPVLALAALGIAADTSELVKTALLAIGVPILSAN